LSFFAFTGQLVFLIFNITLAAFKIAGGILLVTTARALALHIQQKGSGKKQVLGFSVDATPEYVSKFGAPKFRGDKPSHVNWILNESLAELGEVGKVSPGFWKIAPKVKG